jgi:hypothetical protein
MARRTLKKVTSERKWLEVMKLPLRRSRRFEEEPITSTAFDDDSPSPLS